MASNFLTMFMLQYSFDIYFLIKINSLVLIVFNKIGEEIAPKLLDKFITHFIIIAVMGKPLSGFELEQQENHGKVCILMPVFKIFKLVHYLRSYRVKHLIIWLANINSYFYIFPLNGKSIQRNCS